MCVCRVRIHWQQVQVNWLTPNLNHQNSLIQRLVLSQQNENIEGSHLISFSRFTFTYPYIREHNRYTAIIFCKGQINSLFLGILFFCLRNIIRCKIPMFITALVIFTWKKMVEETYLKLVEIKIPNWQLGLFSGKVPLNELW